MCALKQWNKAVASKFQQGWRIPSIALEVLAYEAFAESKSSLQIAQDVLRSIRAGEVRDLPMSMKANVSWDLAAAAAAGTLSPIDGDDDAD